VLLSGAAFKANPHPTYARLRAETPAYCRVSRDGATRMWFLTRYDDVAAALRDDRRFVKDADAALTVAEQLARPAAPPLYRLLTRHMLNTDGDAHARLRALVNKAFGARRVEQMEPRLRMIAHDLLDRIAPRGEMDYVDDFALPFSIAVIAELLGIPSRDRHRFRAWSHILVAPSADAARNERKTARLAQVMQDFVAYLQGIFTARRRAPQPDLITSLLEAEESGDRLSTEELLGVIQVGGTPPSIEIAAESESRLKPTAGASGSVHLSGLRLSASELIHWGDAARIRPHREVDPGIACPTTRAN
jgi:cytochrome P450